MRPATARRRLGQKAFLIVVATLGVVAITGCAGLRGGQSAEAAAKRIDLLPGVASSEVVQTSSLDGFTTRWFTSVAVTLEADYDVGDAERALEWGVRTAWSVNGHEPTTGLSVGFVDAAGNAVDWDWEAASVGLGYEPVADAMSMRLHGVLLFTNSEIGDSLGAWPGDVPKLADGVIVAD